MGQSEQALGDLDLDKLGIVADTKFLCAHSAHV